MRLDKDPIDKLFDDLDGQFDTATPSRLHAEKFAAKLKQPSTKKITKNHSVTLKKWWLVAASVVVLLTTGLFTYQQQSYQTAGLSPEIVQTQTYFAGILDLELEKLQQEEASPLTQKIIADAMTQLEGLEKEYNNLELKLQNNPENKKLIYAMITNFQMRIELLQQVLQTIEEVKTLNNETHENTL